MTAASLMQLQLLQTSTRSQAEQHWGRMEQVV